MQNETKIKKMIMITLKLCLLRNDVGGADRQVETLAENKIDKLKSGNV